MTRVLNCIDSLTEWTGKIFCGTIFIVTVLTVIEVIRRKVFNSPTIWNFEVTIHLYALHFLMMGAFALKHKSHVNIDLIYNRLSKKTQIVLDLISYALFFFPFMGVLFWYGIKFARDSWSVFETSWSVFGPPVYPLKTVIPVASLLLILQGIAEIIRVFKKNEMIEGEIK